MSWKLLVAPVAAAGFVLAVGASPGCSCNHNPGATPLPGVPDLSNGGGDGPVVIGDGGVPDANACGDNDPMCSVAPVGPVPGTDMGFPLPGDVPPPTNVGADGVGRDGNGWLGLNQTHELSQFLWIADDTDYDVGFISKLNTKPFATGAPYREVARYVTVTCQSDPVNGGAWKDAMKTPISLAADQTAYCDGMGNGCCARDYLAAGGTQTINIHQNRPSRTAVDANGDVWVANRAHQPASLQSSVTKIANKNNSIMDTDCIDRNHNGKIDTSSDVNGDGIITTDCNGDNLPDNAATVCTAGRAHEFYGLDDECILFTTNTGKTGQWGRPLALGPGAIDFGPSDAWAGTFLDGTFYRIDGVSGKIKQTVPIATQKGIAPHPYGAVIDQDGILWAPNLSENNLYYFDTNLPTTNQGLVQNSGAAAAPAGTGFYGIAIDGFTQPTDAGTAQNLQQIWLGHYNGIGAFRYRPVRGMGFAGYGMGTWARVEFTGATKSGRGIGVDNRMPTPYAWVALDSGAIGRIPTNVPDGVTTLAGGTGVDFYPTMQAGTLGAGVDYNLDIWGINQGSSSATHFTVNSMGTVMNAATPDTISLDDNPALPNAQKPHPYTYSDFTGFGLRNFTNPHGYYNWLQTGCGPGKTKWMRVEWDALTPVGTAITMKARSADDPAQIAAAPWTGNYTASPADLKVAPGPVLPNPSGYLQVEFDFSTIDPASTPKLKSFKIVSECMTMIK